MKDDLRNTRFFRRSNEVPSGTGAALLPGGLAISSQQKPANPTRLTPRQLEVLALLCEGLPNKLICRRLNIATGTVKVHISCILRELGVASRLQAVVVARSRGLAGDSTGVAKGSTGGADAKSFRVPEDRGGWPIVFSS